MGKHLLDRLSALLKGLLQGMTKQEIADIGAVEVLGGGVRMPIVQKIICELFKEVREDICLCILRRHLFSLWLSVIGHWVIHYILKSWSCLPNIIHLAVGTIPCNQHTNTDTPFHYILVQPIFDMPTTVQSDQ